MSKTKSLFSIKIRVNQKAKKMFVAAETIKDVTNDWADNHLKTNQELIAVELVQETVPIITSETDA